MIFEILVGRNTPSVGETFAEIDGPLRQMGCATPMLKYGPKYVIFDFSPKVVI